MLVAFVCATATFAAVESDIRTATLIHGNKTTIYYGYDAFQSANAVATDGDVIVLSSGEFRGATITKSISVYGAGYETDTISGAAPTSVSDIQICSHEEYDDYGEKVELFPTIYLEGINLRYFNGSYYIGGSFEFKSSNAVLENFVVRKCMFPRIRFPRSRNCKVSQCVITSDLSFNELQEQMNVENCWIYIPYGGDLSSTITYDHCIIKSVYSGYAHYTNSIILSSLPENCTAHNNIFTGAVGSNVTGTGNWTNVNLDGIFTNASAEYTPTNNFTLCFPKKFVGTDGTEVGINGGVAPFDRISPIPRILSSNIDLRTSDEGKLNVSIQVEAQTQE